MLRFVSALTCLVACVAVAAGCMGDDGSEATETRPATETATAPGAMTEQDTSTNTSPTPDSVITAVWERSYSECSTRTVAELAGKYNARRRRDIVAIAVGRAWARQFQGGADAAEDGRRGCLQGFSEQ